MSMKLVGKALSYAGIVLVVSTLAIDYYPSGSPIVERAVNGERSWEVRKYGYVAGAIGLCLMLCAPPAPRKLGSA